jgi:hypothetical protein
MASSWQLCDNSISDKPMLIAAGEAAITRQVVDIPLWEASQVRYS